ncbi:hypothetical protein PR048_006594 [Dryococelus australis]|uniref:C2H2-type domain-containing protein n=1 Tax=Dryococelus australis TaxID=614101 RepID=A0ABQ9IBD7_9NEOP|nr:hypothetical protein PR048_006594 [Dryococelus australis]
MAAAWSCNVRELASIALALAAAGCYVVSWVDLLTIVKFLVVTRVNTADRPKHSCQIARFFPTHASLLPSPMLTVLDSRSRLRPLLYIRFVSYDSIWQKSDRLKYAVYDAQFSLSGEEELRSGTGGIPFEMIVRAIEGGIRRIWNRGRNADSEQPAELRHRPVMFCASGIPGVALHRSWNAVRLFGRRALQPLEQHSTSTVLKFTTTLSLEIIIVIATESVIVPQTCKVPWTALFSVLFPEFTQNYWYKTTENFKNNSYLPYCLGTIDGKHSMYRQSQCSTVFQVPSRTVAFTCRFHNLLFIQATNTSLTVGLQSPVVVHTSLRSRTFARRPPLKIASHWVAAEYISHQNILASSLNVSETLSVERRSVTPASLAAVGITEFPEGKQPATSASFPGSREGEEVTARGCAVVTTTVVVSGFDVCARATPSRAAHDTANCSLHVPVGGNHNTSSQHASSRRHLCDADWITDVEAPGESSDCSLVHRDEVRYPNAKKIPDTVWKGTSVLTKYSVLAYVIYGNRTCVLHKQGAGCPSFSEATVGDIWEAFARSPTKSVCTAARQLRLYAYKVQLFQALKPTDKPQREQFSVEMLAKIDTNNDFLRTILSSSGTWNGKRQSQSQCVMRAYVQLHHWSILFHRVYRQQWCLPGHDHVYRTKVTDLQDSKTRIRNAVERVTMEMLGRTWQGIEYRLDVVRATRVLLCICDIFGHSRANGSYSSAIDLFGSGTRSAIDLLGWVTYRSAAIDDFRHDVDSEIDFIRWVSYSSSIGIATQANSVKTSMHVLCEKCLHLFARTDNLYRHSKICKGLVPPPAKQKAVLSSPEICDGLTSMTVCNDDVNVPSLSCTESDDVMVPPSISEDVHVDGMDNSLSISGQSCLKSLDFGVKGERKNGKFLRKKGHFGGKGEFLEKNGKNWEISTWSQTAPALLSPVPLPQTSHFPYTEMEVPAVCRWSDDGAHTLQPGSGRQWNTDSRLYRRIRRVVHRGTSVKRMDDDGRLRDDGGRGVGGVNGREGVETRRVKITAHEDARRTLRTLQLCYGVGKPLLWRSPERTRTHPKRARSRKQSTDLTIRTRDAGANCKQTEHALDDSTPITDLQSNTKRIPHCQMWGTTGASANEQTSEVRLCKGLWIIVKQSTGQNGPADGVSSATVVTALGLPKLKVQRYNGNTARLARRSDEAPDVRVSVARIAPSLLDLERGVPTGSITLLSSDPLLRLDDLSVTSRRCLPANHRHRDRRQLAVTSDLPGGSVPFLQDTEPVFFRPDGGREVWRVCVGAAAGMSAPTSPVNGVARASHELTPCQKVAHSYTAEAARPPPPIKLHHTAASSLL